MNYRKAVLVWNNATRIEERAASCPIGPSTKGFAVNTLAGCVRGLCYALHTNTEKDLLRESAEDRGVTTHKRIES